MTFFGKIKTLALSTRSFFSWINKVKTKTQRDIRDVFFDRKEIKNPLQDSEDFYLENLPVQPKNDIAEYASSKGILVPRRFSFSEAQEYVREGGKIIMRSENRDEYDWDAWLFYSYNINLEKIELEKRRNRELWLNRKSLEEITSRYDFKKILIAGFLKNSEEKNINIAKKMHAAENAHLYWYCKYLKKDMDNKLDNLSFSYWEQIPWYNRSVIIDKNIENRFHVFTKETNPKDYKMAIENYTILENGKVVMSEWSVLPNSMIDAMTSLIEGYQEVTCLERFSNNHAPVLEYQTTPQGEHYFLQYHRSSDKHIKNKFQLDRPLKEYEIETIFSRGITNPEWEIFDITIKNGNPKMYAKEIWTLLEWWSQAINEYMSKRRKVIIKERSNLYYLSKAFCDWHLWISEAFNTDLYVVLPKNYISENYKNLYFKRFSDEKQKITTPVKITANWNRAIVEFLDKK